MTGSTSGRLIYQGGMIAVAIAAYQILAPASVGVEDSGFPDPAVTVAQVKKRCFKDEVQVTGVLVPRQEVVVRQDGKISEVLVEVGDTVKSGQVLARLSPLAPLEAQGRPPEGQGRLPEGQGRPPEAQGRPPEGQGKPPEGQGKDIELKAPVAGIITFKSPLAFVGSFASAKDGPPLFQIAKDGEMELVADTPVETLQKLESSKSAPAKIVIVGMFDRELDGKIRLLSSTINPMTQLGQVRLTVASDRRLRVGAFGMAVINLGESCNPAVPISAILYAPGGSVVQVVHDGRVQTKRVRVGLLDAANAEILDRGLSEGEMVIAKAGAFFRDDDRVRAVATSESSAR
jgi:HlyD family secretion protein